MSKKLSVSHIVEIHRLQAEIQACYSGQEIVNEKFTFWLRIVNEFYKKFLFASL